MCYFLYFYCGIFVKTYLDRPYLLKNHGMRFLKIEGNNKENGSLPTGPA